MLNPLLGMPQGAEWIYILLIVIVVFGAAKLPDLARSSGQALRIFKAETKGLLDDDKTEKSEKAEKSAAPDKELPTSMEDETPVEPKPQADKNNS